VSRCVIYLDARVGRSEVKAENSMGDLSISGEEVLAQVSCVRTSFTNST
jgi:hypothetical protein